MEFDCKIFLSVISQKYNIVNVDGRVARDMSVLLVGLKSSFYDPLCIKKDNSEKMLHVDTHTHKKN
jgi:hypothetical protein